MYHPILYPKLSILYRLIFLSYWASLIGRYTTGEKDKQAGAELCQAQFQLVIVILNCWWFWVLQAWNSRLTRFTRKLTVWRRNIFWHTECCFICINTFNIFMLYFPIPAPVDDNSLETIHINLFNYVLNIQNISQQLSHIHTFHKLIP